MEKFLIGKIIKPQGLSGEVKCQIFVDYNTISDFTEVYLKDKDVPTRVIKKDYRFGYLYLTLSMIDDRNKADLLRNFDIYIDKKFYTETKENVFLIDELIGCKVYAENGEDYGEIIRVENYGATDILIIFADQREYEIPFLKEIFIKISTKSGIVTVDEKKFLETRICN